MSSTKKQKPLKTTTTEILELKNTMTKLKHSTESFNSRLDQVEERINELEDRSFEIIQSEDQKEKRTKKSEKRPMGLMGHYQKKKYTL